MLASTTELDYRERLRGLIDKVWDTHLSKRSNTEGIGKKYWDFPPKAYSQFEQYGSAVIATREEYVDEGRVASWYMTERVMEALVARESAESRGSRARASAIESFVRELSDYVASELELTIRRSGSEVRGQLEELRDKAILARRAYGQGKLTHALSALLELVDELEHFQQAEGRK